MSERLQRAVSFTIEAGYQLDKDAFIFLNSLSKTEDPIRLMEETIKKLEATTEKAFFIDKNLLEEVAQEAFPKVVEDQPRLAPSTPHPLQAKKVFRAYAKDVDSDIEIVQDPSDNICESGTLEEYLEYFQDRFKRMKKILRRRMDVKDASSISDALEAPTNSKVKIIGMITEKREAKQQLLLSVEDLEASATVLVSPNRNQKIMKKARDLLLDQVICIAAVKGRDSLFIAEDIIWPDIPQRKPNSAPVPVYAALLSDLHIGSRMFMKEAFTLFLLWLNGKLGDAKSKAIASHVKYLIIAGDIVDGIGIYPKQREELVIEDIHEQYRMASKFIEEIPDYIDLIIIPGNHDASRKALPQPAIPQSYAESLNEARKVYSLGNPCTVSLHGVELLLCHGRSLDDIVSVASGVSFDAPEKAMKLLLQSRHMAPVYGGKTPIAPEKRDFMVIERPPDILHCGHVHVLKYESYRGTLIVNSGAWQEQTKYQEEMGLFPTPGIVPIVNLQTLEVIPINFTP
ncbi:MAG: DNA-directed DNA polymerase II small subunit [Candidatus Bathyarchaeota archaeon]|nr:MAG: DNA-directed DNA polymerase II small subunit [Candidatus Bathyarchaeota archaeon]